VLRYHDGVNAGACDCRIAGHAGCPACLVSSCLPATVAAGARILLRYLKTNAIPVAKKAGEPDPMPRAA
jgi:hypothetical protein